MEVGKKMGSGRVDREKMCVKGRTTRPSFKKVQVVYYLSRNGQLQHPHYMEVTHLAHQHLRLKDVVDRLSILRGKGMPSLYSWSCKRNHKNGYVWNDLAENDVIYPSDGDEYVLKGSELIHEKLRHLQVGSGNVQLQESCPKQKSSTPLEVAEMAKKPCLNDEHEVEEEYEDKTSSTTPRPPHSRRISTDELNHPKPNSNNHPIGAESSSLDANSFSSATSSTLSEKSIISRRDEDGDEALVSRNSLLFSLITCGGSASFRKERKMVVCKAAGDEEDVTMSEKEYFSGSIVEGVAMDKRIEG